MKHGGWELARGEGVGRREHEQVPRIETHLRLETGREGKVGAEVTPGTIWKMEEPQVCTMTWMSG